MLVAFLLAFSVLFTAAEAQCGAQFTYNSADQRCYFASRNSATWAVARQTCINMGSQLAVVHDGNSNLASDQAGLAVDPNLIFWIGLQITGGMFQWVDGSMMDYVSWNSGYPRLVKGLDCVAQRLSSGRGFWENLSCANSYPFICQANATFIPTTTTAGPFICHNNPYYGPTGYVTSPNYPANYPDNAQCMYNIILAAGTNVRLHMDYIMTEQCCDFLYIYNGPTTSSQLLQRCAGTTCMGLDFYSTSNTMTLLFTSDASINYRGFNASFYTMFPTTTQSTTTTTQRSPCTTYNATNSGSFTSLNYPNQYLNNLNCFYILNAMNGLVPSIYFRQFRTEASYDFVYFYDSTAVTFGGPNGVTVTGSYYMRLSGTTGIAGNTYQGRTQTTVLLFHTDESNTDIGFDAQFTSVSPTSTTRTG